MRFAAFVLLIAGCTEPGPAKPGPLPEGVEILREITLTDDARLPENDPHFVSADVELDRIVYHFDKKPKLDLDKGHVISGGSGEFGYLRRVKAVDRKDRKTWVVRTGPAELTDLIHDGAFEIVQDSSELGWLSADETIVDPLYRDQGQFSLFTPSISGFSCSLNHSVDGIQFIPTVDVDLDPTIHVDVDSGSLDYAKFVLDGSLTLRSDFTTTEATSTSCNLDVIAFLRDRTGKKNLFAYELPKLRAIVPTPVGPVTIVINHKIEPTFSLKGTVETAEGGLDLHSKLDYTLSAGSIYEDGAWKGVWETSQTGELYGLKDDEAPPSTQSLSAQVAGGIQYIAMVWDTVGPKAGIEVQTTAKATTTPTNDCGVAVTLDTALVFVAGGEVQIPVIEKKVAEFGATFEVAKDVIVDEQPTCPLLEEGRLVFPLHGNNSVVVFDPNFRTVVGEIPVPDPYELGAGRPVLTALVDDQHRIWVNLIHEGNGAVLVFDEQSNVLGYASSGQAVFQQMIWHPTAADYTAVIAGVWPSGGVRALDPFTPSDNVWLDWGGSNIIGMAEAPGGGVLAGDISSGTTRLYDGSATLLATVANAASNGMAADGDGNMYMALHTANEVRKYDATGNLVHTFTHPDLQGPETAYWLASERELYVPDGESSNLVIFSPIGSHLATVDMGGYYVGTPGLVPAYAGTR